MFSIIMDQLKLRDIPIGVYGEISRRRAWLWMVLIMLVTNVGMLLQGDVLGYLSGFAITLLMIYVGYRVVGWWLASRGDYDGTGNLWGLFVTSETISMAMPLFAMIHPALSAFGAFYFLVIFANALKSGLGLSNKTTFIALVITIGSAMAVVFAVSAIFAFFMLATGLSTPETLG